MSYIESQKLKEILCKMNKLKVLVIGDLMLDEYIWGKVERISPEAPVPIVDVVKEEIKLGGAGNVVRNLASLGCTVYIGSVIGIDDAGDKVRKLLRKEKTNLKFLMNDDRRQTTVKTRLMAHTQQLVRIDREDKYAIDKNQRDHILYTLGEEEKNIDAIVISDYNKGVVNAKLISEIIKFTKDGRRIPIIADPKKNFLNYKGVDILTPNLKELGLYSGNIVESEIDVVETSRKVIESSELKAILVTKGPQGMSLIAKDFAYDIPTFAQEVYDVTGAGDTVIACFTLALLSGASTYEAALISNVAAGIVVGEVGAAVVTQEELLKKCIGIISIEGKKDE